MVGTYNESFITLQCNVLLVYFTAFSNFDTLMFVFVVLCYRRITIYVSTIIVLWIVVKYALFLPISHICIAEVI